MCFENVVVAVPEMVKTYLFFTKFSKHYDNSYYIGCFTFRLTVINKLTF